MENVHAFQNHEEIMDEAYAWVLKFNGDTPVTAQDIQALNQWAARSPAHQQALKEAEDFWCEAELLTELAVPVAKTRPGSVGAFFSSLAGVLPSMGGAVLNRGSALAAMAFVGLGLTLALWLLPFNQSVGNGLYSTAVGEQKQLILRDGSQVQLDTYSQVRVDYQKGARKIILLNGKAHFDVAKNPQRPFEVYAGDGLVRAVGTAFSVYLAEDNIEVLVDEGRVDLARVLELDANANTVDLSPEDPSNVASDAAEPIDKLAANNPVQLAGQSVVGEVFLSLDVGQGASFDRAQQVLLQLSQKELDNAQAWRKGTLVFVRDPLSDVVYEVSRYTDITIEITEPSLRNLVMGGRFKAGDLDALLEVLEIGFGVKVIYLNERHVQLSLASND